MEVSSLTSIPIIALYTFSFLLSYLSGKTPDLFNLSSDLSIFLCLWSCLLLVSEFWLSSQIPLVYIYIYTVLAWWSHLSWWDFSAASDMSLGIWLPKIIWYHLQTWRFHCALPFLDQHFHQLWWTLSWNIMSLSSRWQSPFPSNCVAFINSDFYLPSAHWPTLFRPLWGSSLYFPDSWLD